MTSDLLGHVCQNNAITLDLLPDGRQVLTMTGIDVYASLQRRPNGSEHVRTVCCSAIAAADGQYLQNATCAALDLVHQHCGPMYSPVWLGRGWSVQVATGYPVWRVTA